MSTEESTSSSDSSTTTSRSFDVHHQSIFITDAANEAVAEKQSVDEQGLLALDDEPFETTLFDHGIDVDTRQQTSRIETGGSDEFIDDRPLSAIRPERSDPDSLETAPGLQGTLFTDTACDQRTLNDDQASARFMFNDAL